MKNKCLIIVILMLTFNFVYGQKQITFWHLGWTGGKAILPLELYPKPTACGKDSTSFCRGYIREQFFLRESLIDSLYNYIIQLQIPPLDVNETGGLFNWGIYAITYNDKTECYEKKISRKNAVVLFEGIKQMVRDKVPLLYEHIEESILSRIRKSRDKIYCNGVMIEAPEEN